MKIRVIKGFRDYVPGQVFEDWPGGMCEILIGQGFIEPVVEVSSETSTIEAAEDEPVVERADASPRRKRK